MATLAVSCRRATSATLASRQLGAAAAAPGSHATANREEAPRGASSLLAVAWDPGAAAAAPSWREARVADVALRQETANVAMPSRAQVLVRMRLADKTFQYLTHATALG